MREILKEYSMKKLVLLICLVSLSAQAEVVITGGFGTDGATGESMPLERSVQDAVTVYKSLKVKPDGRDDKTIEIKDGSFFECSKPYSGIYRLNAGCSVTLRASQKGKLVRGAGLSAKVTFSGKLATALFNALPKDSSGRVGASTRKVANVSCSKAVRPGVEATCTITDANAIALEVDL